MSSEESPSKGKMVSYSIGGITAAYLEAAYAILVFFFYEVEVGLPIEYVALGYIIFALFNMVNDPFIGYLTDKPRKWSKKWGMRFPWIMISMFPMIIFYFLVYTPPAVDAKTNPMPVFLYMVIMLCLFDFFYSLYSTHYYGTFTMQFRTDDERRNASVYTNMLPAIGGLGLSLIPPLFIVFGDISSYTIAIFLVVIVLAICLIIGIPGVKESEELKEIFIQSYDSAEKMSYIQVMKIAFRKKNFIVIMLVYTLFMSGYLLTWSSEIYFYKDVLEIDYSYAILSMIAVFLCFVISIPIWSLISKKIGHTKTLAIGILFTSITILPYMWINTLLEYIIWAGISGFGFGAFYFMIGIAIADVNDEVALDLGKRQEATLTGIRVFFYRAAFIVQGLVLIIVHTMTGYNPDPKAKQTPLAVLGVRIHYALVPAILSFIAFLIFIIWYDLKDEKKEQIFSQLREKGLK